MLKAISIFSLLILLNVLNHNLYSQKADEKTEEQGIPYTWYDGDQARTVYLLKKYVAIANDSSQNTKNTLQILKESQAKKVRDSGRFTIYENFPEKGKEKRRGALLKTRPVFSEEQDGAPEMILGDDIFVYFKKDLKPDDINEWATKNGVIVKRQFLANKNGWIINVKTKDADLDLNSDEPSPLLILETARKLQNDKQNVVKTIPKWFRSNIQLK